MNKIVQSCLSSFCKEIAQGTLDSEHTSVQFEHFINYLVVKREFLDDFDYERFYVGGGGDCGIDGIAILVNNEILDDEQEIDEYLKSRELNVDFVFIQSKTSESFCNKDLINFLHGIHSFFSRNKKIMNAKLQEFTNIKDCIYEYSSKFKANPRLHIRYAYNGHKNNTIDMEQTIDSFKENFHQLGLFDDHISIEILDCRDIQKIYREVTSSIKKTIKLDKITTVPYIDKIQESYIRNHLIFRTYQINL